VICADIDLNEVDAFRKRMGIMNIKAKPHDN